MTIVHMVWRPGELKIEKIAMDIYITYIKYFARFSIWKVEVCAHRYKCSHFHLKKTGFFSANQEAQLQSKKVVKSKFKHDLPFMVADLLYKLPLICLEGTSSFQTETNWETHRQKDRHMNLRMDVWIYVWTWITFNVPDA